VLKTPVTCITYEDKLALQLRKSRKEESRLQTFLKEADVRAEKFNSEIAELRKKIGSRVGTSEVEKTLLGERGQIHPRRPPMLRKEMPRRKDNVRASLVAESLQECDDHLLAIFKCDEKIARFEELLKQMRTDLYNR